MKTQQTHSLPLWPAKTLTKLKIFLCFVEHFCNRADLSDAELDRLTDLSLAVNEDSTHAIGLITEYHRQIDQLKMNKYNIPTHTSAARDLYARYEQVMDACNARLVLCGREPLEKITVEYHDLKRDDEDTSDVSVNKIDLFFESKTFNIMLAGFYSYYIYLVVTLFKF